MNKSNIALRFSPAMAGLFLCLMLTGCVTAKSPEQVTLAFWSALSEGDLEKAKSYATEDSRDLVSSSSRQGLENVSFETGRIIIDGEQATVETMIHAATDSTVPVETSTFLTVLTKTDEQWKIDYRKTQTNLSGNIFGGFFKSLEKLGEKFNKHLEQQMPKIEKELESLGNELEKQMDEFGDELEQAFPPEQPAEQPGTI
ncbi:MAG: nuclear transport factor 2 family protein [Gammaproteobacteria bacterium]